MNRPEGYTAIWSCRWSVGYGWRWIYERECRIEDAQVWLDTFKRDEPRVSFRIARNKPRT